MTWVRGKYLKCADQVGRVCSFVRSGAGVMIDDILLVVRVIYKLFEFCDVLPGFAEVERAEVLVEIVIDEVLFEIEGTLSILK